MPIQTHSALAYDFAGSRARLLLSGRDSGGVTIDGEQPARYLLVSAPAGFKAFIEHVAEPGPSGRAGTAWSH